jgi:hypothetical protein
MFRKIALIAVLGVAGCSTEPFKVFERFTSVTVGDLSVEIPASWHIQRDSLNHINVSPRKDEPLPGIGIEICRSTHVDCRPTCEDQEIRRRYGIFDLIPGAAMSTKFSDRGNGEREFFAAGTIPNGEGKTVYSMLHVRCSTKGIMYFSMTSDRPDPIVMDVFKRIAEQTSF